ncbi:MAG TPA: adenylate/guanylate cyclase domain-containing protein [Pirellulales bacterium]|nr:adenylate/guanylate cyclase domain-containing protein [Pirellulales bacterium]
MAELIAQGPDFTQRWRRRLNKNQPMVVGRQAGVWSTPWDDHISRQHIRVCWNGQSLMVEQMATARNPVFVHGNTATQFQLRPGEHFVIGKTTFTLSADNPRVTLDAPEPDHEQVFSAAELRRVSFRNAQERIELLSRLPEVIKNAASDTELFVRLVNLLLAGVPRADAVALVAVDAPSAVDPNLALDSGKLRSETSTSLSEFDAAGVSPQKPCSVAIRLLHWDGRRLAGANFQPSQRLIQQALAKRETVLHTWTETPSREFTESESIDWAYCTPLPGDACRGWALYLAGRFGHGTPGSAGHSDSTDIRDDMKFTELAAATLSSLRELNRLGRRQAGLSQFFAPVVMDALATDDPETVLTPRETEVTVLFCDLRGFSRTSERSASDLLGLLERVSKALGVMTHQILDHGGVVGDFQGDAAMGFWGWPLPQSDAPQRAALAALAIRAQFEMAAKQLDHPLADFRAGIGIATGRAVAGKIGTVDHVKVTVFGPVVNLAARLESMTKFVNAPILLDPTTAAALRRKLPPEMGRIRRVATVRPYGMTSALEICELLPPQHEYPEISDQHLHDYESALDAFVAGQWSHTLDVLQRMSAPDPVKDFLTVFIAKHRRVPPPGWDGIVTLESK